MDFKEKGFLSKETTESVEKHRLEYSQLFDLAEGVNSKAHILLSKLPTDSEPQRLTSVILYLRALNAFAAVVRLLNFGMAQESGIIVRSLVEITIFLAKASSDKKWISTYIELEKLYKRKYLNANFGDPEMMERLAPKIQGDLKERIDQLNKEVKEDGLREFNVYELAEQTNLKTLYDTAYRWFSTSSAHASVNSLDQLLRPGEEGNIEAILHGPNMTDAKLIIATACTCLCEAMKCVEKAYSLTAAHSVDVERMLDGFKLLKSEVK